MLAHHASYLALAIALLACASGSHEGASSGSDGGTTTSGSVTSSAGTAGAGGTGGSDPCPAPTASTFSFKGVYSTTFDNTMDPVSSSFGDPNTSTLTAHVEGDMLVVAAKNSAWDVEIDMHLEPNISPPLSINASSFPNYVGGASFSRGAGLANTFFDDGAFVVTVKEVGCRIKGTFSGGTSSSDGLEILTIGQGAFDVQVTATP